MSPCRTALEHLSPPPVRAWTALRRAFEGSRSLGSLALSLFESSTSVALVGLLPSFPRFRHIGTFLGGS